MPKKTELKVIRYAYVDGVPVRWEELTQEQRDRQIKSTMERLSKTMSDYYSHHIEEFKRLVEFMGEITEEEECMT